MWSSTGVTRTIDTWSFGCVLLVVATWIVLGRHNVLTFEQLRVVGNQQESKERNETGVDPTGSHASDSFHNGRRPLRMVTGWISKLKNEVKVCDTVTVRVLELVEKHMLLGDPTDRYLFDKVCERWNGICEEAQVEYSERLQKGQLFQYQDEELVDQALKAIEKAKRESTSSKQERSKLQSSLEISMDGNQTVEVPAYLTSRDTSRVSKQEALQQVSSRITPHRLEAIEEKYAPLLSNKSQPHPFHSKMQSTNKPRARNPLSRPIPLTTSDLEGMATPVAEKAGALITSDGSVSGTTPTNVMFSADNSLGAQQLPSTQQPASAASPAISHTQLLEVTAVSAQAPTILNQPSNVPMSLTQSPGPMDPSPLQEYPSPSPSPKHLIPWHAQSISELPWEIFTERGKMDIAKSKWHNRLSHFGSSWRKNKHDELGPREMVSITEEGLICLTLTTGRLLLSTLRPRCPPTNTFSPSSWRLFTWRYRNAQITIQASYLQMEETLLERGRVKKRTKPRS
jgi:hypothetical protein